MRFVYLIFLLVIIAALAIFAIQNENEVRLKYLNQVLTFPLALGIGAVYLLGMISGWTVVGIIKRSFQRVTEQER